MRIFILLALALSILTTQAAEVYRYIDEKGNIAFTDQPRAGAQRIVVEPAPATSVVVPVLPTTPQSPAKASSKPGAEAFTGYTDLRITQPSPGESLLNTVGDVDVSLNLHPRLRADLGHGLTVLLDGTPVAQNTTRMNLVLNNVDRGDHVLEAYVQDGAGAVLIQSAPVRFTLQRPSLLQPGRQAPGVPLNPIPPPVPQLRPVP
ncbi:MAG: DUF4124 domain-containing protein [Gammaproteobacteria bacterium]|nr:DUF4124 domain-containing protein [Gammaproteobacteria bacterium]